jgi:hypothetical protein
MRAGSRRTLVIIAVHILSTFECKFLFILVPSGPAIHSNRLPGATLNHFVIGTHTLHLYEVHILSALCLLNLQHGLQKLNLVRHLKGMFVGLGEPLIGRQKEIQQFAHLLRYERN